MPRPLPIALIAALCIASNALAIDKIPGAMKRIVDKAVAEVKKNRQEFEQANQAPLRDAREELQALAQSLIGDGKTEEAQTVLRQVKSLDADVLRMAKAPDPAPAPEPRPGPQKPLLERMAGKWRTPGQDISIQPDGSVLHLTNGDRGQLKLISPDMVELSWNSHWKWQLRLVNEDMLAVKEWNPQGQQFDGIVLERIN